jgi:site-specific recombinase XerD
MPSLLAKTFETSRTRKHHTGEQDLVFCYKDGKRLGGTWWAIRFSRAMNNFGIDREGRKLRPHSFRHTLNTFLCEKGYDSAKVRSALGWADERIPDNYTHFGDRGFDGHRSIVDSLFAEIENKEPTESDD